MAIPIAKADLEARIGAAEVVKYSRGTGIVANDVNVAAAIAQGWDSVRSDALNVYTAASWDAMTAESMPPVVKRYAVQESIGVLSSGQNRPDYLDKMAEEAKQWRSFLATDNVRSLDVVLTRLDAVTEEGSDIASQLGKTYLKRTDGESYLGLPERT